VKASCGQIVDASGRLSAATQNGRFDPPSATPPALAARPAATSVSKKAVQPRA